jgi:triphosphoribosyl-dephospho-CoA synthase
MAVAEEAGERAAEVARAGWPKRSEGWKALSRFDAWLREPGTKRNPGTTADLVGATLYVALAEGILDLPSRFPWWNHESPWP